MAPVSVMNAMTLIAFNVCLNVHKSFAVTGGLKPKGVWSAEAVMDAASGEIKACRLWLRAVRSPEDRCTLRCIPGAV